MCVVCACLVPLLPRAVTLLTAAHSTPPTVRARRNGTHPNDTFTGHLNGTFNGQKKKTLVSVAFLGGFVGYVVSQFVFLPTFLLALGGGGFLAYMATTRK